LVSWSLETPGAPPLVLGPFDTERATLCHFTLDTTGQLRCLPPSPGSLSANMGLYSDSACARPIYIVSNNEAPEVREGQPFTLPGPVTPGSPPSCAPVPSSVGTLTAVPASAPVWAGSPCGPSSLPKVD